MTCFEKHYHMLNDEQKTAVDLTEGRLLVLAGPDTGKPDDHVKAIAKCRALSLPECDDYFRQLVAYKLLYERYHKGPQV